MVLHTSKPLAAALVVVAILAAATRVWAQQTADADPPLSHASDVPGARDEHLPSSTHMFGVLPNYTTVEEGDTASRITTKQTFQMAALGSFDPYVFPFVGVVTAMNHVPGQSYAHRYMISLADNSIGNFLTTAVMPRAMGQDPRYCESGKGSVPRRIGYAASRSVITRSRAGNSQFNVSELGGNALAATL